MKVVGVPEMVPEEAVKVKPIDVGFGETAYGPEVGPPVFVVTTVKIGSPIVIVWFALLKEIAGRVAALAGD